MSTHFKIACSVLKLIVPAATTSSRDVQHGFGRFRPTLLILRGAARVGAEAEGKGLGYHWGRLRLHGWHEVRQTSAGNAAHSHRGLLLTSCSMHKRQLDHAHNAMADVFCSNDLMIGQQQLLMDRQQHGPVQLKLAQMFCSGRHAKYYFITAALRMRAVEASSSTA